MFDTSLTNNVLVQGFDLTTNVIDLANPNHLSCSSCEVLVSSNTEINLLLRENPFSVAPDPFSPNTLTDRSQTSLHQATDALTGLTSGNTLEALIELTSATTLNDTIGAAQDLGSLTNPRTISGSIGNGNDPNDYFRFSLANTSSFNLSLRGLSADADVELLDSQGRVIASSTNSSANSESIVRTLNAGTYYVRVYPFFGARTDYDLILSATPQATQDAGNSINTARDLGSLTSTRTIRESIGNGSDTNDYFRFSLANTSSFNLSLRGLSADADVQLLDSQGRQIAISENANAGTESIVRTLNAGTYFVRVYPFGGARTDYELNLSATTSTLPTPTPRFNSTFGYGLVNAAAAVARAIGQATFSNVTDLGGNNWGRDQVNAPEVWTRGYQGQGITVAVIDSGVDIRHSDLDANIWRNPRETGGNGRDDDRNGFVDDITGWNFEFGASNGLVGPGTSSDGQGHGTFVSGIIAAEDNGFGITGVAPRATIMPIRLGDVSDDGQYINGGSIASAIRYAVDNGARVINMSLSSSDAPDIRSALEYAASRNVITVSSAGNERDNDPANATRPSFPANTATSVGISVGAIDRNRRIADFSNLAGNDPRIAHVVAPGVDIFSTEPGNNFGQGNGTSYSAPHVAGVVALMLSANPNLTASQVRQIITETATQLA